ncbi:MAG: transporter [Bacteroidota bacterium]|nr:transporter [Bacteroidota bacterium]
MKKVFIIIIFTIIATNLFAQYEEEADHIVKDPSNSVSTNAVFSQEINDFYLSENNMSIGSEMMITHNLNSFNIPFYYKTAKLENWSFNAFLPIIVKKEASYQNEKARGIGDLTIGGTYSKIDFIKAGFIAHGSLELTLPTGNDEKEVNNIPIPLGNGTFGFTANFSVIGKINKGTLYTSMNYRLNTNKTTTTKNSYAETTYKRRSPSIFSLNGSYDYPILEELRFTGAILINYFGKGRSETEIVYSDNTPTYFIESDIFQEKVILGDISTKLEYKFGVNGLEAVSNFLHSAYLKVKIPVLKTEAVGNRYGTVAFGVRKNF